MNTRHLYTFQDGRIIVLEHIVSIGTTYTQRETSLYFQVDMIGDVCYCYPDVEFEKTRSALQNYKTTERAELIKALAAI
jgi:hypothetical protein